MELNEKLAILEDVMDIEDRHLQEDEILNEIDEWDSISRLSFMIMMDRQFNKKLESEDVKALKTVRDMLDIME